MSHDILLESGTNEVEILEFYLDKQSFGINVAKVMQIIPFNNLQVTEVPEPAEGMLGVIVWREDTIPLIDLNAALKRGGEIVSERPIVLVTEFNAVTNAFLTDGVNRIHRLGWDEIRPSSEFLENYSTRIIGSVSVDNTEILLVDFEFIIAEYCPETKVGYSHFDLPAPKSEELKREDVKIVLAEDSQFIRNTMVGFLHKAGYTSIAIYENGLDAYNEIMKRKEECELGQTEMSDALHLIITDIEMPQMDGLTLCRKFKKDMGFSHIPVVVFSSLINEQMADKCSDVGADAHITKPEISQLVSMVDELVLLRRNVAVTP